MAPGRKAGTLVRATCCGCGEVELRRGVSARYRCLDCKQRHEQTARTNEWLGGHAAMIAAADARRMAEHILALLPAAAVTVTE